MTSRDTRIEPGWEFDGPEREPERVTPGREALAEAARLEAARVYGHVVPEHKQPKSVLAAVAEAELNSRDELIGKAIEAGCTNTQIMQSFSVRYGTVRAIRKKVMRGAA